MGQGDAVVAGEGTVAGIGAGGHRCPCVAGVPALLVGAGRPRAERPRRWTPGRLDERGDARVAASRYAGAVVVGRGVE